MRRFVVEHEHKKHTTIVDALAFSVAGKATETYRVNDAAPSRLALQLGDKQITGQYVRRGGRIDLLLNGNYYRLNQTGFVAEGLNRADVSQIRAEIPGRIAKIFVVVGQVCALGTVLMTHEAMKMEIAIKAPCALTVTEILVAEGAQVNAEELLVKFESATK